jgi:hypothetical protein
LYLGVAKNYISINNTKKYINRFNFFKKTNRTLAVKIIIIFFFKLILFLLGRIVSIVIYRIKLLSQGMFGYHFVFIYFLLVFKNMFG